jgi:hypothetical protein
MPKKTEESTHIRVSKDLHMKLVLGALKDNDAKIYVFTEKVIKKGLAVLEVK